MIGQKKRTYHFETSSLLSLKLVLLKAEKEAPPHAGHEQKDINEELALNLITSMRKRYKRLVFNSLSPKAECQKNYSIEKVTVLEP